MLARSKIAAPDRVKLSSPTKNSGNDTPRNTTSACAGNWPGGTTASANTVPTANVSKPAPRKIQGQRRRGRFRAIPIPKAAVLDRTVAAQARMPNAGTSR
jgi:hypothetical protein